jgi:hypothetical protein
MQPTEALGTHEPGFEEVFVKLVDRLDPPTAT